MTKLDQLIKKNNENKIISNIIIAADIRVSLLVGQMTLDNSCLTCLTNRAGDVFLFSNFFPFLIGRSGRT